MVRPFPRGQCPEALGWSWGTALAQKSSQWTGSPPPSRGLPESTLEVTSAIKWILFAQDKLDHPWTTPEPLHSVPLSPPLRLELLSFGGWESGQLVLTSPNS